MEEIAPKKRKSDVNLICIIYQEESSSITVRIDIFVVCLSNAVRSSFIVKIDLLSSEIVQYKEAVWRSSHRKCSIKKLFLKTGQYSLENTCVGVKPTQVFSCEYCEIFRDRSFEENLRTAVSLLP